MLGGNRDKHHHHRATPSYYGAQRMREFQRMRRRLAWAMIAMVVLILIGVIGYASMVEGDHGLVDAVYMTVITLTTVGYGEVIDMTNDPDGRIFTMIILIFGMGIFAYTVPLLAAFLIEGHVFNVFSRRRMEKQIATLRGHTIVCGDSPSTWFVVEELTRTDRPVVLVVPLEEELDQVRQLFGDVPALVGDPSDDDVLIAAGIERAAGVIAGMEGDKDNVLIVFTARRLAPQTRIIASLENPNLEAKLRVAGADAVVSPSKIGGLRIASELVRPTVVTFLDKMLRDESAGLRMEEIRVPHDSPYIGKSIEDLQVHEVAGAVLLALRYSGEDRFVFDPAWSTKIEKDMSLILMIDAEGRKKLTSLVKE